MVWLFILIAVALAIQIILFVVGRKIRKREKENSMIEKYDIHSRQKAWQLIGDMSIPEEDRKKIKKLYDGSEE